MRILFLATLLIYLITGFGQVCFAKAESKPVSGLLSVAKGEFQPKIGRPVAVSFSNYSKGALQLLQHLDGSKVDVLVKDGKVESITAWKAIGLREVFLYIRPETVLVISKLDSIDGQFSVDAPGKEGLFKLNLRGRILESSEISTFVRSKSVSIEGIISEEGSAVDLIQLRDRTSNETLCELELTR
jgi:hypothetical protein